MLVFLVSVTGVTTAGRGAKEKANQYCLSVVL